MFLTPLYMKALIIEDNIDMSQMVERALKKDRFVVDTAHDGDSGFQKALKNNYDIVLLDLMLPQKSGFEIIAQLRARGVNTPILVVSGRTTVEDRVKGLEMGADDYLVKNFSLDELLVRVKTLLRRNLKVRRNLIKAAGLIINLSDMSLTRNGVPIYLSKKELNILMSLIKNKNEVVPRCDIVNAGWSESDPKVSSNTVDVHIKSLRSKLNKPFPNEKTIIETIRGYGYIIRDK